MTFWHGVQCMGNLQHKATSSMNEKKSEAESELPPLQHNENQLGWDNFHYFIFISYQLCSQFILGFNPGGSFIYFYICTKDLQRFI